MPPFGPVLVDLSAYVASERVLFLDAEADKSATLLSLARLTSTHPNIGSAEAFERAIFEREEVSSTGVGGGIAVPHAKIPTNQGFVISIGVSRTGLAFDAKDGQPVHIIVMIAASDAERDTYLRVLATVAARLKDPAVSSAIHGADAPEQVVEALLAS
jgi:mannitol/fructose-specific phosphotransferase system IIA component (Ntr-type)